MEIVSDTIEENEEISREYLAFMFGERENTLLRAKVAKNSGNTASDAGE